MMLEYLSEAVGNAMQAVTLTGDAVHGLTVNDAHRMLVQQLPITVMLGRNRPAALPSCNRLDAYAGPGLGDIPYTNYRAKAAEAIARMYLNDRYGDCVFAGKYHQLGVWSANDSDSGGIVLATDAEVQKAYFDYTGGRDSGANISEVLDIFRSKGLTAGGKPYKIDGYVSVDHKNIPLTKAAQFVFGATSIGINLPSAWTNDAVWDVTNTGIVGGHDVTPVDCDDTGVYILSWGRVYRITWPAWTSTKWIDEYYAPLSPLWYGPDKVAPNALDLAALQADLQKVGGGVLPDVTPPPPTPQPTPTAPYSIAFANDMKKGPFTVSQNGIMISGALSDDRPAGNYLLTHIDPVPPGN